MPLLIEPLSSIKMHLTIWPGCITHPQAETNEPQLRILLTPILSAHLNTKEIRKDKDLQMALRYQNSLSSLITDKLIPEVSESPNHFHSELTTTLLILG